MGEGVHTITKKTDRSYLRDTEKGLNKQESFTVSKLESKIRNRKTEKAYVVDANGKVSAESYASSHKSAAFRRNDLERARGGVLTHNHPTEGANSALRGTLAGRIGLPFSAQDFASAIEYDLKEIRAVTPTYTYSVRRPKGGWGNYSDIAKDLRKLHSDAYIGYHEYRDRHRGKLPNNQSQDRANVGVQYSLVKNLAKKYGWEFTRRKV